VLRHFHAVLLSFKIGVVKPDPEAYRLAVEAAGCPMENRLFIDDRTRNVEAAAALGMQTHTFRDTDGLIAELGRRGLL
jgi:HAD superfamily hydrolase (TIGR01509 family)